MQNELKTQAIIDNLVIVKLTVSSWSGMVQSRTVEEEVEEKHEAAKGSVDVRLRMLDKEYTKPISGAVSIIRRYWYDNTSAWEDGGNRVVRTADYHRVIDGVARLRTEFFDPPVDKLKREYDEAKAKSKERLNGLFEEAMFPERMDLDAKYGIELSQSAITNPDDIRLKGLDDKSKDEIKASMYAQIEDRLEGAVRDLVDRMRDMVRDVHDRLAVDPTEKIVLYKRLWTSMQKTIEVLPKLNITDNPEVTRLIGLVQDKIAKHDPDAIREDAVYRCTVRKAANEIMTELDNFSL